MFIIVQTLINHPFMTIEKITIIGMEARSVDVTSAHDSSPQEKVISSIVEAIVTIRNQDAARLKITTEFEGMVYEKEAITKLYTILRELK